MKEEGDDDDDDDNRKDAGFSPYLPYVGVKKT